MSIDRTNNVDINSDNTVEPEDGENGLVEVGEVSSGTKGGLIGGSMDTSGNGWKVG